MGKNMEMTYSWVCKPTETTGETQNGWFIMENLKNK
jgi:hypothetical protein